MSSKVLAGRYRLEESLSTTPMAEVFAARDAVLDRRVVVKLLAPSAERARFEREAKAAAALAHPNIVQVFDYGEEEGRPYMVFEYLPGGSLEQRLAVRPSLPDDETARIAADIAAGLAHAHGRGVIHRDLKPANVMFDGEGRAKIADFGIAHLRGEDTLTDAGTILGTAAYISPEQADGEPATAASDVYSFGVLLYRMLAGRPPFESDNAIELAAMHREAEPVPLSVIRPDAPRPLAVLAMAALAKDPALRPVDGSALVAALGSTGAASVPDEGDTLVIPTPPPHPLPRRRPVRVRPIVSVAALGLLVLAGLFAALLLTNSNSPAPAVPLTNSGSRSTESQSSQPTAHSGSSSSTSTRSTTSTAPTTTGGRTATRQGTSTSVPATSTSTTTEPLTTTLDTTIESPTTGP